MVFSFLVVVQIIDKFHVGTYEAEYQTPVARNVHRPETLQIASQHMQAISRTIHVERCLRNLERSK